MLKNSLTPNLQIRRAHSRNPKGSFLIEASVALFLLVAIAIVLVNASSNILQPRVWTMSQNLADAYLSQEVAAANRVDFSDIAGGTSAWRRDGAPPAAVPVELGRYPGFVRVPFVRGVVNGRPMNGVLTRRRRVISRSAGVPDFKPSRGTFLRTRDLGIQCYALDSHLTYTVGTRTYVKSRTVIRSQ